VPLSGRQGRHRAEGTVLVQCERKPDDRQSSQTDVSFSYVLLTGGGYNRSMGKLAMEWVVVLSYRNLPGSARPAQALRA
jgi:hypothetical protein